MPIKKTLNDMNRDSLRYLVQNTDITYLAQGSVARALLESNNLEISRLQDYASTALDNAFLSTATGFYLDLFGEMLGLPRFRERRAGASIEDGSVRFYVDSGTLGSRLPNSADRSTGLIPSGTRVQNPEGTVEFTVISDMTFPVNAKSAFVPVVANSAGASFNVGANQLTTNSLGIQDVKVTNDIAITSGGDIESDAEYRFRLSRAMTSRFTSNATAVQVAALSQPGVANVETVQFARGAGTFDVLLIPQANKLSRSVKESAQNLIDQVTAFGISSRIREPEYVGIKISLQLMFKNTTPEGEKLVARRDAESAILNYIGTVPIGGELIINQIRAVALGANSVIKDIRLLELCLDGRPRTFRNVKLREDELLIPDENSTNPIEVL